MDLGTFSVSLSVKDIKASIAFYAKLGFVPPEGAVFANWAILRNGPVTIGLFQGMFEKNLMTFNPGWDQNAEPTASFTDVRELQAQLEAAGVELKERADPDSEGPAHILLEDPDGNPILIDQHR